MKISKISRIIATVGTITAFFIGTTMTIIAYFHDPQGEFSQSPLNLLIIFASWALSASFLSLSLALAGELFLRFRFRSNSNK